MYIKKRGTGQQAKTKMEKCTNVEAWRIAKAQQDNDKRPQEWLKKKKPPPKGGCVRYTVINYISLII